jgi:hypothetical protein
MTSSKSGPVTTGKSMTIDFQVVGIFVIVDVVDVRVLLQRPVDGSMAVSNYHRYPAPNVLIEMK